MTRSSRIARSPPEPSFVSIPPAVTPVAAPAMVPMPAMVPAPVPVPPAVPIETISLPSLPVSEPTPEKSKGNVAVLKSGESVTASCAVSVIYVVYCHYVESSVCGLVL